MSNKPPMTAERRREAYLAQTGRHNLTPTQAKRLRKKEHALERGTAPHGRLRRRYDRKDGRTVRARARAVVQMIRDRRGY